MDQKNWQNEILNNLDLSVGRSDDQIMDLIDREIEKAQTAAEQTSDFGEDLGRRISDAVQRAMSFSFNFGKKNKDKEE